MIPLNFHCLPFSSTEGGSKILHKLIETQEYMQRQVEHNVIALTKCVNKHDLCTQWSILGECTTNPSFMDRECSPACRTCDKLL